MFLNSLSPDIVSEARSVDDGDLLVGEVAQEVSLVGAGLLGHGLGPGLDLDEVLLRSELTPSNSHLEAAVSEETPLELVGPPQQDVRKAGLADPGAAEDDNSGKQFSKFTLKRFVDLTWDLHSSCLDRFSV